MNETVAEVPASSDVAGVADPYDSESALDPYRKGCPTRRILDRIGDTWTVLVVGALDGTTLRFSDLLRRIDGISQKMLTQTLRALERDGLVERTVYPQVPVKVEYALTLAGESLLTPLRALEQWSIDHFADVAVSQRYYDTRAELTGSGS